MEDRNVKEVIIDAMIDGETRHPTKVSLCASINSIPYAVVEYVPDSGEDAEDGSIPMGSSKVFENMGELQTKMFNVQDSDSMVTMTDAKGNTIMFSGRANAPTYALTPGDVSFSQRIDHEMSLLNVLNTSCYIPVQRCTEYKDTIEKPIPEVVLAILKEMEEKFDVYIETSAATDLSKKAMRAQHNLNQDSRVKGVLEEIMQQSLQPEEGGEGTRFAWDKLPEWADMTDGGHTIKDRIVSILRANTGGFFGNLLQLANDYQELYIPDFESAGYLRSRRHIFNGAKIKKVDIISCTLSTGSLGWFPSRAVGIEPPEVLASDQNTNFSKQSTDYITYPELPDDLNEIPSIIPSPAPPWLPKEWMRSQEQKVKCGTVVAQRDIMEVSQVEQVIRTGVVEQDRKHEVGKNNIIFEWAKNEYIWEILQSSTCSITTELSLDFEVGVRYRILNSKGEALFSGLLVSVSHNAAISGQEAKATTDLMFSHVVFLSATIPNVK